MDDSVINGKTYVRETAKPQGTRAVVVVDRGWMFAGDVTEENGRIYLDRAVWVYRWESISFAQMLESPHANEVDIRRMHHRVDIPVGSEIFRIPVDDDWGL